MMPKAQKEKLHFFHFYKDSSQKDQRNKKIAFVTWHTMHNSCSASNNLQSFLAN
jgi:hypothetical protein